MKFTTLALLGALSKIRSPRRFSTRYARQVLKLHEMNVEIERPKILAARRLNDAVRQRKSPFSQAESSNTKNDKTLVRASSAATRAKQPSRAARLLTAFPAGQGEEELALGSTPPGAGMRYETSQQHWRSLHRDYSMPCLLPMLHGEDYPSFPG